MTFKSKVEEICMELTGAKPCSVAPCPFGGEEHSLSEAECAECGNKRILAAYKEAVEGMPKLLTTTDGGDFAVGANHGVMCQHNSDRNYLLKEIE